MNRDSKREQIEAIDDEVNSLHPLLHQLFNCLKGVSYVEYTHGPNEMGADFVLERIDEAIQETHYVGVVAKTEKILQNFSDVERQIDECGVKRLIRQGTQEIRLQEVWVITSKSVSHNAKEKINEKFAGRKILFLESDWLVDTVDKYQSFYWDQLPNALGSYLGKLTLDIAQLDAQTSLLNVASASSKYIELDVIASETEQYRRKAGRKKRRPVNFLEEILLNKITVLEAEMGFGKSRLARHLVTELATPQVFKKHKTIPIYKQFALFLDTEYSDIDSLIQSLVGERCYEEARSDDGKFLLILDGVDESNGHQDRSKAAITRIIEEAKAVDYVHVLFTTRPFKLSQEMAGFGQSVKRYAIQPLSIAKLVKFIEEVCEQINLPKKLYQDLAKSELFKQLPQNPIAASLLSNLLSQNQQDLPSNLTELYAKSMDFMLGRWDEKRTLTPEKLFKACERVARELASFMLENKLIYMSSGEARDIIIDYTDKRNLGVSSEEIYDYLLNRSQVFGTLEDGQTIFFRHRSFAEYLYALNAYQLRDLSLSEKAFHPYWTNVCFFYLGLLTECPELLRQLVALPAEDEATKWLKLLNMGKYFLAGYQSPYAVIEDSLHLMLLDAARLYIDVKGGKTKTKLVALPEMSLLWLFAGLTRYSFGYDFFHKALPLALAQIDEDVVCTEEERVYSLFFGACALLEFEDQCGMVHLLGKHKTEALPLPISLAVNGEMSFLDKALAHDPLIRKHEKKLRRLLGAIREDKVAVQGKLLALFEKPIDPKAVNKKM